MYKIEKDVPIEGDMRNLFPFSDMEIGDSIFVKCDPEDSYETGRKLHKSARNYRMKNRNGFKITVRSRKQEGGVRAWRIK